MDDFSKLAYQELEARRVAHRQIFCLHAVVWALTGLLLFVIWLLATPDAMPWFLIPILAWGIFLGGHAAWVFMIRNPQEIIMDRERRMLAARPVTVLADPMTPAQAQADAAAEVVRSANAPAGAGSAVGATGSTVGASGDVAKAAGGSAAEAAGGSAAEMAGGSAGEEA